MIYKKNFNKVIKTQKLIKLFQLLHHKKENYKNFHKIKKLIRIYIIIKMIKTNPQISTHPQQVSDNNLSAQDKEIHNKTKYTLAKMKLMFITPLKIFELVI